MKNLISVDHQSIEVQTTFNDFTYNIEHFLGITNPASLDNLQENRASLSGFLQHLGGEDDLILFNVTEHHELIKQGNHKKAKQYEIGNPALALQIKAQDLRCGLYTPIRLFVYENSKKQVVVEFDTLSSLFKQFENSKLSKIAASIDIKVLELIRNSDTNSYISIK